MEMGKTKKEVLSVTVVNHALETVETSTFNSGNEAAAFASFCLALESAKAEACGASSTSTEIKADGQIVDLVVYNDEGHSAVLLSIYTTILNDVANESECA